MQKATFAAGCFWGVEQRFAQMPGVIATVVGYTGGHITDPSYEDVCHGDTGHAESIQISFDPKIVSYKNLLEYFWDMHNPTTINRQGPDIGSQYRSAIFYHDDQQLQQALESKQRQETNGRYQLPIVTEMSPLSIFYPAEEYHQQYLTKNGINHC